MNRAVAKRTMFEQDSDMQRFFDRLEVAVERCGLEVHAFAVMQNHFHLLVRSMEGQMSAALHLIQSPFAGWFNRTRKRDGPLHRGRFLSELVESDRYRRYLVRYIDANPVVAGLAPDAASYDYGSAQSYVRGGGPEWLTRSWIEQEVAFLARASDSSAEAYSKAFPPTVSRMQMSFTDDTAGRSDVFASEGDRILEFTIRDWMGWMSERAAAADGVARLTPIVPESVVVRWIGRAGLSEVSLGRRRDSPLTLRNLVKVALLTRLCGTRTTGLGAHLGCSRPTAISLRRAVRQREEALPGFAQQIAAAAQEIVRTFWAGV